MSDDVKTEVMQRMARNMANHLADDVVRRREAIMATLLAEGSSSWPVVNDEATFVLIFKPQVLRAMWLANAIMEAAR